MDCKQYQQYVLADSQDENSKKTREWIEVDSIVIVIVIAIVIVVVITIVIVIVVAIVMAIVI